MIANDRQRGSPVFLDRDGTIVREVNFLSRPDQLELLPGAGAAIRRLNEAGRPAIGVTNQPVVAMGVCSEDTLALIHAKLRELLAREGAYLDAIYYCPHDPTERGQGGIAALQIDCDCRKPKIGLIRRATDDLGLDLTRAWLIGDKTTDIRTARNAGLKAILVSTGYGGNDKKYADEPDFVCASLVEAVDVILGLK